MKVIFWNQETTLETDNKMTWIYVNTVLTFAKWEQMPDHINMLDLMVKVQTTHPTASP